MSSRRSARVHPLAVIFCAAAVLFMLFERRYIVIANDYGNEAHASYAALLGGHISRALALAPVYGGSLELRAPFALLAGLWGGGALAVYRMAALPCLLAGAGLGTWLAAQVTLPGRAGHIARGVVLLVCVLNPLTFRAMVLGHPEELLGGVGCVCAVVLAMRNRPLAAGAVLGLAVANKEWAVLAAGPVLLALPCRRVACALAAGAVLAALETPLLIAWGGLSAGGAGRLATADAEGSIFHPWQAWWFAGDTGHVVRDFIGRLEPGYRTAPSWLGGWIHAMIAWLGLPLTLLCARVASSRGAGRPMQLLALLLLLRCLLDPWNSVYYALPFVLAILTWEVCAKRRVPYRAALASLWVWCVFGPLTHAGLSYDAQAALFVAPAGLAGAAMLRELLSAGDGHAVVEQGARARRPFKPGSPAVDI